MLALFAVASGSQVNPYVEDVFSTYLYTGNGSTQTITNGIDLAGEGGLVWIKSRSAATEHRLTDTARGATNALASDTTAAQATESTGLTAFGSTGFTLGADADYNTSAATYVSWAFQKQEKFFDIVTWTGDNSSTRQIDHNLGTTPAFIIIKRTDAAADWVVAALNNTNSYENLRLNTNAASTSNFGAYPTGSAYTSSTQLGIGYWSAGGFATLAETNATGGTYVAYLFAHNAGGFGTSGVENIISCSTYTGNGSAVGPVVTLGYEPQWVMIKNVTGVGNWQIIDTMRGMPVGLADATLAPNSASTEGGPEYGNPLSTGFQITSTSTEVNTNASRYMYVAIRRGPMKVPTTGTSVFAPISVTNVQGTENNTGFPLDMQIANIRSGFAGNGVVPSRLTGVSSNTTSSGSYLRTPSTDAETTGSNITQYWSNTGFQTSSNWASSGMVYWNFRRAPSFFDEVCWTGVAGTAQQINHNLNAVPELIITKRRDAVSGWPVYSQTITATNYLILQDDRASASGSTFWNNTAPTSSVFTAGQSVSPTGATLVAYLFATCLGVSKVGSYTGTGTTQQINCEFSAGSRFVMIKRTDSTGDWYVWDTARGIIAGNDPYLLLNSNAAEVTSTDYVDTYAAGFELTSTAPAAINANGGTYIFLAIA
jgi:hypothetical protein